VVLAAGVPAVYKRAAWSVYNSDKDARVVELRLARIDSPEALSTNRLATTSTVTLSSMVSDHNYSRPDYWDRIILSYAPSVAKLH
jgi:hypothetical protein